MTELKSKFLDLSRIALIEFAVNHPGTKVAAKILERIYEIPEEKIVAASEQYSGELHLAVDEYIKYVFTNGRNDFKKPKWMKEPEDD